MIRPLTEEDLEAYVTLRQRSLREEPKAFSATRERDVASNLDHLRARIGDAANWILLGAFLSGELIAAAGLIRKDERVSLWGMYVAPEYRRCGVGRAILDACVDHARSLPGVKRVELAVRTRPARRLYERAGFRSAGGDDMFLVLTESSENTSV